MITPSAKPWSFCQDEKFPYRLRILDADGAEVVCAYPYCHSTAAKTLAEHQAGIGFKADDRERVFEALNNQLADFRMMAAAPQLLEDLAEAAATLRRYETLHRAKNTEDSLAKAEVNAALAARFEATIAKARGDHEQSS